MHKFDAPGYPFTMRHVDSLICMDLPFWGSSNKHVFHYFIYTLSLYASDEIYTKRVPDTFYTTTLRNPFNGKHCYVLRTN